MLLNYWRIPNKWCESIILLGFPRDKSGLTAVLKAAFSRKPRPQLFELFEDGDQVKD